MVILSLDIASETGWAISNEEYGTWMFKTMKDESMGMKLIRFKAKLNEFYSINPFDIVVYERPAGRHTHAIIHQSKLIAILESFCVENGIEYKAYSASHIKKFATGKGNAGKQLMVDYAKIKYGYDGKNDNEADALHLLNLFKSEING
jgi:Holliday junction resolvasome RuvABC endonuclease subunit